MIALPPAVAAALMGAAILGVLTGVLAYVTLLERKFAARMQSRVGPYRVGPHGLLQPIADGVKNIMKEETLPPYANKALFFLAPMLSFAPAMMAWAVIPFGASWASKW
ncbi:MAG TPA: complex I subunit 1 family protein, partial [Vicinamibacterales bacterium]|nr:complex I subunit 1 family protein [Vicinamibacterales bacterium]